ncbi:hypothetical protein [Kineococcus terrestris]|uniref:hypothetical protein n=1 Tax=Kineococcus terrestris TaxID=2044856 RepID=UPI0034DB1047
MRLHAVYRTHGGENAKGRPEWYSKEVALQSFLRAVERARGEGLDVELVVLGDGPLDPATTALARAWGDLVTISAGDNRRSYLHAVSLPRRREWPAGDLVLLAEDDYLWRPDALVELVAAARSHPDADYLAPYGPAPDEPGAPQRWERIESTTSTFAARAGALRQDERLLALCAWSGGDFDVTTCMTLAGRPRFSVRDLVVHHPTDDPVPAHVAAARHGYLAALRLAVDARAALRRPARRRALLGARPVLATHGEEGWVAPGDWAQLAESTRRWAAGALA